LIDVFGPSLIFRPDSTEYQMLHEASKAFIEPDVVPPLHGNQVSEPLVADLMTQGSLLPIASGEICILIN